MGEIVEYTTDAGTTRAYLAVPASGSGPGIVVVQEWWGLVDHIRDVCDRFAAEDFLALAPDLYRGETTTEPDEATRKMQEVDVHTAALELAVGIGYVLQHPGCTSGTVGVVGYCMGGALALIAGATATGKVGAVDSYYGVFWYGDPQFEPMTGPVVMRVGTNDEFISLERIEELAQLVREAGADVTVRTYEGAGHAFFNDSRPEAYRPEAAQAAWQETLELFRTSLASREAYEPPHTLDDAVGGDVDEGPHSQARVEGARDRYNPLA